MTPTEIADFVCQKLELMDPANADQSEPVSQSRAISMAKSRFKMIWKRFTWQDSLILVTQEVTAASGDSVSATAGTVEIDDTALDIVISVAWDDMMLQSELRSNVLRLDPNLLKRVGTPILFSPMPRNTDTNKAVIRLSEFPSQTKTLTVLGKRLAPELGDTEEPPPLPGLDEALLAYVEGDMLERLNQRQDAQVKYQEANSHLVSMHEQETQQSGVRPRLIPGDSMGDPSGDIYFQD
ncbi:MAG: hypothetical protein AAFX93_17155 [Verrucomicrobiota bacterium]